MSPPTPPGSGLENRAGAHRFGLLPLGLALGRGLDTRRRWPRPDRRATSPRTSGSVARDEYGRASHGEKLRPCPALRGVSAGERADPPQRPVLLVNPKSGGGKAARAGLAGSRVSAASTSSSCARTTTSQRWSQTPWRAAPTRSASPVATDPSPSWRPPLEHTSFLSSAFPPARATTSRSTSASIGMIWSGRSTRSPTASNAGSTWRR